MRVKIATNPNAITLELVAATSHDRKLISEVKRVLTQYKGPALDIGIARDGAGRQRLRIGVNANETATFGELQIWNGTEWKTVPASDGIKNGSLAVRNGQLTWIEDRENPTVPPNFVAERGESGRIENPVPPAPEAPRPPKPTKSTKFSADNQPGKKDAPK